MEHILLILLHQRHTFMKTYHDLFLCAAVIATGFVSCGKDDSSGSGLAQTCVVKDSVRVDFSLVNSRGDTTATFNYGEDIVFDLKVQSLTNDWLFYGNDYELFDSGENNLFHVYSEDSEVGNDYGSPVSLSDIGELQAVYLGRTLAPRHFKASWLGAFKPSYPLSYTAHAKSPLPRGSYHVEAPVHVFIDHRLVGGMPEQLSEIRRIEEKDTIYITCDLHFTVE